MKNIISCVLLALALLKTAAVFSQSYTTITGHIKNSKTGENIPAVSVVVKGGDAGTFTDENGNFKLITPQTPPFAIVISSIGFTGKEVQVSAAGIQAEIVLEPSYVLGQDIVVAASRVPERILESPVSIERVSSAAIQASPATDYYDVVGYLPGVDVTTSSLTFKTPTTRGFNGSGNPRFNQIVDGMDNQAPGLNFSVGSVNGLSMLDVESMELLEGASSALYGSGGMNGTLLINSKDPFKYQGFSAEVKEGVMNVDNKYRNLSAFHDFTFRWAQKVSDKFAFKVAAEFTAAKDWLAADSSDYANPGGSRTTDPAYDGVNVYGDETNANMLNVAKAVLATASNQFATAALQQYGVANPTQAQINGFLATNAALVNNFLATNSTTAPFYLGKQAGIIPNQVVSRTGYKESDVINPNTIDFKVTAGLYYKISRDVTASLSGNYGTGNSVYTGSDRYALKDLQIGQYKAEVKGSNWYVRSYTTQENSGNAYNATVTMLLFNEAWKPSTTWFPEYVGYYVGAISQGANAATAQNLARAYADQGRPAPGSQQFQQIFNEVIQKPIPEGGKFLDRTALYETEGQYNLTKDLGLKDKGTDVLIGASWKQYVLNSQGTLFADTAGRIHINEEGVYAQLSQKFFHDVLKLTASGRYDKSTYFDGHFTPRFSAVITVAKDQNFRISYQTAYRFPTTQNQWINLNIGDNTTLIGGLPALRNFYNFNSNPVYTQASFQQFAATGNPAVLQVQQFGTYKPESSNSFEVGYKGLFAQKLLVDIYVYYAVYQNYLSRENVFQSPDGTIPGLANPNIFSVSVNSPTNLHTDGSGLSVQYLLRNNFFITANVYTDELTGNTGGLKTYFNTPKYRANIGFGNSGFLYKSRIGFNVIWHWQDNYYNEADFVQGNVPAYSTIDGQISYKLPKIKSVVKLGATNMLNHYYINAYGNPIIGGLYYISYGFNVQ